jgi:hypothetical protein
MSDDDFGDFEAVVVPTVTPPSVPTPVAPSHVSIAGSNQTVDDDDFGDFDAAPSAAVPAFLAPPAPHTSDGDDFGDFDAAPVTHIPVTPAPIVASPNAASPNASDDDGFLAFDGATATALASPSTISPTMPTTSASPVKSYTEVLYLPFFNFIPEKFVFRQHECTFDWHVCFASFYPGKTRTGFYRRITAANRACQPTSRLTPRGALYSERNFVCVTICCCA